MKTSYYEELSLALAKADKALSATELKKKNEAASSEMTLYYAHGATDEAGLTLAAQESITLFDTKQYEAVVRCRQVSDNLLSASAAALESATATKDAVSKAAVKFQDAANALASLSGNAATVLAIATAADRGSEIQKSAQVAHAATKRAAYSAEKTSLVSLKSTMEAARTNAAEANANATAVNTDLKTLEAATQTQQADAQAKVATDVEAVAAAMNQENLAEGAFETAYREDQSAHQTINYLDKIANQDLKIDDPFQMGDTIRLEFVPEKINNEYPEYWIIFVEESNVAAFNWEVARNLSESYCQVVKKGDSEDASIVLAFSTEEGLTEKRTKEINQKVRKEYHVPNFDYHTWLEKNEKHLKGHKGDHGVLKPISDSNGFPVVRGKKYQAFVMAKLPKLEGDPAFNGAFLSQPSNCLYLSQELYPVTPPPTICIDSAKYNDPLEYLRPFFKIDQAFEEANLNLFLYTDAGGNLTQITTMKVPEYVLERQSVDSNYTPGVTEAVAEFRAMTLTSEDAAAYMANEQAQASATELYNAELLYARADAKEDALKAEYYMAKADPNATEEQIQQIEQDLEAATKQKYELYTVVQFERAQVALDQSALVNNFTFDVPVLDSVPAGNYTIARELTDKETAYYLSMPESYKKIWDDYKKLVSKLKKEMEKATKAQLDASVKVQQLVASLKKQVKKEEQTDNVLLNLLGQLQLEIQIDVKLDTKFDLIKYKNSMAAISKPQAALIDKILAYFNNASDGSSDNDDKIGDAIKNYLKEAELLAQIQTQLEEAEASEAKAESDYADSLVWAGISTEAINVQTCGYRLLVASITDNLAVTNYGIPINQPVMDEKLYRAISLSVVKTSLVTEQGDLFYPMNSGFSHATGIVNYEEIVKHYEDWLKHVDQPCAKKPSGFKIEIDASVSVDIELDVEFTRNGLEISGEIDVDASVDVKVEKGGRSKSVGASKGTTKTLPAADSKAVTAPKAADKPAGNPTTTKPAAGALKPAAKDDKNKK